MMRIFWIIICVALLGSAAVITMTSLSPSSSAPVTPQREIAASPVGQCVNLGGALEAPVEGSWGYIIRERDLHAIRALGFDTIRVPIKWSAHAGTHSPYTIDEAFFARVDTVAAQALAAGLQVIIDVHHYDELNETPAAHLPRLYAMWEQISAHYEGWPSGLMFEFLNEPHTNMSFARVNQLNRDLLSMVRETHPDRWVILGGGQWGTLEGMLRTDPPYDPHAMVTFHYYEPFEFTHQGAPWAYEPIPLGQTWGAPQDRQTVSEHFAHAIRFSQTVGMPVLLGEFGVYEEVPDADRARWTHHIRRTAEVSGFGWCYWDWATSLGMYDLETERLRPGMGTALLGN